MTWQQNTGRCPPQLVGTGKRVHVRLRNGYDTEKVIGSSGWPAWSDRKPLTRWTLTASPFDIVEWKEK